VVESSEKEWKISLAHHYDAEMTSASAGSPRHTAKRWEGACRLFLKGLNGKRKGRERTSYMILEEKGLGVKGLVREIKGMSRVHKDFSRVR